MSRQKGAGAIALALLLAALMAAPALASYNQFMTNMGLSAGNAYADGSAHYNISVVSGYADHTHCDAVASGYGGYTSTPNSGGHFTAHNPTCGPGYTSWSPNGTASYQFHGAEYNPNGTTFDTFSYADVGWNCAYFDGWIC